MMDMTSDTRYQPPLSLTILGTIFIGIAGCISLFITQDIIRRKGWKSMMGVMYVYTKGFEDSRRIVN